MEYKEITDLFTARDKAIQQKDKDLLRSTQLFGSRFYMPRATAFATEVINIIDEGDEGIQKVVFVKEKQSFKDYGELDEQFEANQVRFRVYHLINTALGWKIFKDW